MRTVPRSCGFRASGANSPPCSFEKCVFCAWAGSARELFGALLREVFFVLFPLSCGFRFPDANFLACSSGKGFFPYWFRFRATSALQVHTPGIFLQKVFFLVLPSFLYGFYLSGADFPACFFGRRVFVLFSFPEFCPLSTSFLAYSSGRCIFRTASVSVRVSPSRYELLSVFSGKCFFVCFRFRTGSVTVWRDFLACSSNSFCCVCSSPHER